MTVDSYESLYYDKGHEGLQNEIDRLERKNDELENINDKLSLALKSAESKIERLTAESTEWESKCYNYQDIIKEVREYMSLNMIVKLNEEFGETMQYKTIYQILDKGSDKNE